MAEKNGKIQIKINERIRKVSECYNLATSLLWNKDTDRKSKIIVCNVYFRDRYTVIWSRDTGM
jgi:hypothetical protein